MTAQAVADRIVGYYDGTTSTEQLIDLLSDDVVVTDLMSPGETFHGAAGYRAEFDVIAGAAFPDAVFVAHDVVFDGALLCVRATFTGTFAADIWGVSAHGGSVSWQLFDIWEIRDEAIVRIFFGADTKAAHDQLGSR